MRADAAEAGWEKKEKKKWGRNGGEPDGPSWSSVLWKAPFLKCVCVWAQDKDQQRVSSVASALRPAVRNNK